MFELSASSNFTTLTQIYAFSGSDGANPQASLVKDATGNLFGTTEAGGNGFISGNLTLGDGTVFELAYNGTSYAAPTPMPFFTFNGTDGANPFGNLIQARDGKLYGTTEAGGASSDGTVFQLTEGGSLTTIHSFSGMSDGANPHGGLVQGITGVTNDDNLYGTTTNGGTNGDGTVFQVSTDGTVFTPLYTFGNNSGDTDGANPYAGLTEDTSGDLFGTTAAGGDTAGPNAGDGTVFELANSSGVFTFSTLYTFTGGTDGANPHGALFEDTSANLFGTAQAGGNNTGPAGAGTVFELRQATQHYLDQRRHAVRRDKHNARQSAGSQSNRRQWQSALRRDGYLDAPDGGTFSSGGGTTETSVTDSSGMASITDATLGANSGPYTFTATISTATSTASVTFTATAYSNGAMISGVAYFDPSGTGTRTADDSVIGNIVIELTGTAADGTAVDETTTTDAGGFYSFLNLAPGTYQISTGQTPLIAGNNGGTVNASFTLTDGEVLNQDIAFTSIASQAISLRILLRLGRLALYHGPEQPALCAQPDPERCRVGGAQASVINLAGNFSEADMTDPFVTFTVAIPGDPNPETYEVELFGKLAPQTVANFLSYVESGAYNDTLVHRVQGNPASDGLSIVQGGGFTFVPQTNPLTPTNDANLNPITTDPDVPSEFGISNTANTLAMALSGARTLVIASSSSTRQTIPRASTSRASRYSVRSSQRTKLPSTATSLRP